MKSAKELVAQANSRVKTVTVQDAMALVDDPDTVFVDLRDSSELQRDGKVPGAVHVNRGMLEFTLDPTLSYHNACSCPADSMQWRTLFMRVPCLGCRFFMPGRTVLPEKQGGNREKRRAF